MIERIARVLVAYRLSRNAEGQEAHAGASVDMEWEDHVEEALAILRAMREPHPVMARAGDGAVWSNMIAATLAEAERRDSLVGQ